MHDENEGHAAVRTCGKSTSVCLFEKCGHPVTNIDNETL